MTMKPDDVLAHACRGHCIEIGSWYTPAALRGATVEEGVIPAKAVTTWLVKNTRLMTVIKAESGTRIYDHRSDFLYYASEHAQLSPQCPTGHAFLAQAVCDRDPATQGETPRLLIMDLLHPGGDCPSERGHALRRLSHVFPPLYHVQWSGERESLEAFLCRGMPHDVECVVALGGPGRLVREPSGGIAALKALQSL